MTMTFHGVVNIMVNDFNFSFEISSDPNIEVMTYNGIFIAYALVFLIFSALLLWTR